MGAYNFETRFVPDILADRKRHTIRARRKYPDKPGSTCHLFTGPRFAPRLLKRRRCVRVQNIEIYERGDGSLGVLIDGIELRRSEKELLARSDGFPDFDAMSHYWLETNRQNGGPLVFEGDLIHWESDEEYRKRKTALLNVLQGVLFS